MDFFLFTGSYPLEPQGWHFMILLTEIQLPSKAPHSLIASDAYWEHEGVCLHEGSVRGEMIYL